MMTNDPETLEIIEEIVELCDYPARDVEILICVHQILDQMIEGGLIDRGEKAEVMTRVEHRLDETRDQRAAEMLRRQRELGAG